MKRAHRLAAALALGSLVAAGALPARAQMGETIASSGVIGTLHVGSATSELLGYDINLPKAGGTPTFVEAKSVDAQTLEDFKALVGNRTPYDYQADVFGPGTTKTLVSYYLLRTSPLSLRFVASAQTGGKTVEELTLSGKAKAKVAYVRSDGSTQSYCWDYAAQTPC